MRGAEKITAGHRERTAIVYIRQSSLAQVRDNTESTARQYALADEAVRLGWARQQVEVIDADLGLSGRSADRRPGFKDLVGRVCVGEVGAIFGLEVSRLARSSADLSRLLELARLTDTLVIDADGIYDLANFNDRLLLGLKGTMSEAELHFLAGRLQGAKRAAAERGELRFPLPVGFVYDDEGDTIIDPDTEVQAAVADVFAAFRTGGSAYQVVAAFKRRRFPLRAYGGVWAGQLRWGRLTHSRVLGILANPAYAGTYVFGRYHSRRVVSPDGVVSTKTVELPARRLARRHPRSPSRLHRLGRLPHQRGPPGRQLDQRRRPPTPRRPSPVPGDHRLRLLRAADDHPLPPQRPRRLRVLGVARRPDGDTHLPVDHRRHHRRRRGRTTPRRPQPRRGCVGVGRRRRARRPPGPPQPGRRAGRGTGPLRSRTRRTRLPRLRTGKPARRPQPRSPLGAASGRPHRSRQDAHRPTQPLCHRCHHGPNSKPSPPTCRPCGTPRPHRHATGKRLLRTLIADVTLLPEPDFAKARIGIRWHTGATDELVVARRQDVTQYRRTDPAAIVLARSLANLPNHDIACRLNAAGHTTGAGRPFDNDAVASMRHYHQIPPPGLLQDGELTAADIARRLGIGHGAVIHWINQGWLPARRGLNNQWCIPFGPHVETACRERVSRSAHIHKPDSTNPQTDHELTINEVAAVLGISTNIVYYWIERHHVEARRGPGGRLFISFGPDIEAACRGRVTASVHLKPVPQPQTLRSTSQEAV